MAHQFRPRNFSGRNFAAFRENAENTDPADLFGSSPPSVAGTYETYDRPVQDRSYLEELSVGALTNAQTQSRNGSNGTPYRRKSSGIPGLSKNVDTSAADTLADDLDNFHIYSSPGKENDDLLELPKLRGPQPETRPETRPESKATTTQAQRKPSSLQTPSRRKSSAHHKQTHFALPDSPRVSGPGATDLVKRASFSRLLAEPGIHHVIEKHDDKRFDYILSLPRDASERVQSKQLRRVCSSADLKDTACDSRKVYFGCNILRQRPRSRSSASGADSVAEQYTLIATPLSRMVTQDDTAQAETMADTLQPPGKPDLSERDAAQSRVSVPRSPASSVARIEDTIEELDRLEDQFEAVNRIVHIQRVPSPDKDARAQFEQANGKKVAGKTKTSAARTSTASQTSISRTASVRRTASTKDLKESPGQGPATPTTGSASKRLGVVRPASLLPPKPPAKSTKAPTKAAFELPGEAVARRLKEQREARLAAAAEAAAKGSPKPASQTGPQLRRTRSSKPPTVPSFELPGEAISRRKREEHEAKIRKQEEEERRRREFKAKPIRVSVTPSTVPRETISSRSRQNRVSILGDSNNLAVPGPTPTANKRLSLASSDSSSPAALAARGRSRAASTSTASASVSGNGKRASISAEDVQHQKLRGKEICKRDNVLSSDRDRERREREDAAKRARQEAAERSRLLSREWAEKQKLKKSTVSPRS